MAWQYTEGNVLECVRVSVLENGLLLLSGRLSNNVQF